MDHLPLEPGLSPSEDRQAQGEPDSESKTNNESTLTLARLSMEGHTSREQHQTSTCLNEIPTELLLIVLHYLPPESAVALSLTCRGLYRQFFDNHKKRLCPRTASVLVELLEKDLADRMYYCQFCHVLKPIPTPFVVGSSAKHSPGPLWQGPPYNNNNIRPHKYVSFHGNEFVSRARDWSKGNDHRDPSPLDSNLCQEPFKLWYSDARILTNQYIYGGLGGSGRRGLLDGDQDRRTGDLRVVSSRRARVIEGELFLRFEHKYSMPTASTALSPSETVMVLGEMAGEQGICNHFRSWELCCAAGLGAVVPGGGIISTARRSCHRCYTDAELEISLGGSGGVARGTRANSGHMEPPESWSVTIRIWHQLGSGRSTDDPKWLCMMARPPPGSESARPWWLCRPGFTGRRRWKQESRNKACKPGIVRRRWDEEKLDLGREDSWSHPKAAAGPAAGLEEERPSKDDALPPKDTFGQYFRTEMSLFGTDAGMCRRIMRDVADRMDAEYARPLAT